MVFENIGESITNKNNTGIKNLRQGLVYNRNRKRTKLNVIEGFKEGVDQATIDNYKGGSPTKPWLSSGPYHEDGKGIMRDVGDDKERIETDDQGRTQTKTYKDQVRNYKGRFDEMRAKEFAQYEGALKKFNEAKKKYETEYGIVNTNYTAISDNILTCKSNCTNQAEGKGATNGMSADDYKTMFKKFCDAGCTFNGPQLVNSCKDTWKGLKNKETDTTGNSYSAGATCAAFHPTCDKNNNMIMRGQHSSELLNYKDINGSLLKEGCCSCGAGAGGIPTYSNEGIFHKSCDSLKLHACGSDGKKCGNSSSEFMNKCKTPPIPPPTSQTVSNRQLKERLKKSYQNVVTNNSIMKDRGEFLLNKINTYDKQLNSLKNEKNNEEETYDEIISNYKKTRKDLQSMYGVANTVSNGDNENPNELYSKIMENKLKMSKDWSRDVMVEESKLRRRSEEMKFWMWSILAIVVGWATIINFRKKVT